MSATHSPLVEPDKQISRHPALLKAISPQACAGSGRRCLAFWLSFCLSNESFSGSPSPLACFFRASIRSPSSVVGISSKRFSFPLTAAMFPVRPLRSTVVTRFLATMGPSDSRPGPFPRLWIPSGRCGLVVHFPTPCRVSQVPRLFFPCALSPSTPEGPTSFPRYCLAGVRLHPLRQTGHLLFRHEAESGSLPLRLTGLLPRFPPDGLLHPAPVPLHVRTSNLHGELLSVH